DDGSAGYIARLHDEVAHEPVAVDGAKRGVGDHPAIGVGSVVARVLELLLQDADHRERQAIDDDAPAGGIDALAEDPLRQLVAEEQYPPPALDVGGVDETSARSGVHVADRLVLRTHALEKRVGARLAHLKRRAPPPVRDASPVDVRDRVPEEIEILLHEPDASSLPQAGECLAGLTAVDHEHPFAGTEQAVAHGALQALPERQQQHDRERPPGYRKEGEEGPGPLRLQVAEEILQQDVE